MNDAERIAALEARIAELEQRLHGIDGEWADHLVARAACGILLGEQAMRRFALMSDRPQDETEAMQRFVMERRRDNTLSLQAIPQDHLLQDEIRAAFSKVRTLIG